jgi:hypothetical protein
MSIEEHWLHGLRLLAERNTKSATKGGQEDAMDEESRINLERGEIVDAAERKLFSALIEVKHSPEFDALTPAEYFRVVMAAFHDSMASRAKYLMQLERREMQEKTDV